MGRYIVPILLLVIAIGSFVALTNPLYGEIKELQVEESAYSNALANSLELEKLRDSLVGKQNQLSSADVGRLERMIPDSVDNIKLAIELQQVGEENGLTVESVQYEPETDDLATGGFTTQQPQDNRFYDVFELEIVARGTYTNFIEFLQDVEKNLRIVDIVSVEFNADGALATSQSYAYNITVKTYRLKD